MFLFYVLRYYAQNASPGGANNNNNHNNHNNNGGVGGPAPASRFGSADARASYSERRLMGVRPTAHNHPSLNANGAATGAWSPPAGADKTAGVRTAAAAAAAAALSRSNGSLAAEPFEHGKQQAQQQQRTRAQVGIEKKYRVPYFSNRPLGC